MIIQVKTKKWGNSIGIIIPSSTVDSLNIKPGEEVEVNIEKKGNVLKEMFGRGRSKKSVKKMVDEARKEMESDFIKW